MKQDQNPERFLIYNHTVMRRRKLMRHLNTVHVVKHTVKHNGTWPELYKSFCTIYYGMLDYMIQVSQRRHG